MGQNSQYRSAQFIADRIHDLLGRFLGYRTLYADGRLHRGAFQAIRFYLPGSDFTNLVMLSQKPFGARSIDEFSTHPVRLADGVRGSTATCRRLRLSASADAQAVDGVPDSTVTRRG